MTDKGTLRYVKMCVRDLGLKDKMDFFHWLMQNVLQDLEASVASETKDVKTT